MKVSGFTFIRNAIQYDYPIVEAIQSILPVCDEMIVCIGNSEDETEQLIRGIDSDKIKIIQSVWDDSLREGGAVLAKETDKALDAVSPDSDWCFYIQGDEVMHEMYQATTKLAMEKHLNDSEVEGLLFKYLHFYGSYQYVGDSRKWYGNEIRIIRNNKKIRSYRDAQGFRKGGDKLNVKPIEAYIYHYGWVKNPYHQQLKQKTFHKLWHSDEKVSEMTGSDSHFDYSQIDSLSLFKGSQPSVMLERIKKQDWDFNHNIQEKKLSFKNKILYLIEKITGKKLFIYKNYRII